MRARLVAASIGPLLLAAGCRAPDLPGVGRVPGGDAQRGAAIVQRVGCGACHAIPDLRFPRGLVGPPLGRMGRRTTIAGVLANTPDNMVRWIQSPQSIKPGDAMPDMGLDAQQARDVAAYVEALP